MLPQLISELDSPLQHGLTRLFSIQLKYPSFPDLSLSIWNTVQNSQDVTLIDGSNWTLIQRFVAYQSEFTTNAEEDFELRS